jgi:hypothetical protein
VYIILEDEIFGKFPTPRFCGKSKRERGGSRGRGSGRAGGAEGRGSLRRNDLHSPEAVFYFILLFPTRPRVSRGKGEGRRKRERERKVQ